MKPILINFFVIFAIVIDRACGHGILMTPTGRSALWMYDKDSPINYDANGLNCGGYDTQHATNKGKCGLCGDDYRQQRPRPNENGGRFGQGVIAANYTANSTIDIRILVTANHKGRFYFSVCPLNTKRRLESEQCFQPIRLANGQTYYNLTSPKNGNYFMRLKLPANIKCKQCVLRWHWIAGNNWGVCPDGKTQGLGCGPQEEFINCSDISIS